MMHNSKDNLIDLLIMIFMKRKTTIHKYLLSYLEIDDKIKLILTSKMYFKMFKTFIYNMYISSNFTILVSVKTCPFPFDIVQASYFQIERWIDVEYHTRVIKFYNMIECNNVISKKCNQYLNK